MTTYQLIDVTGEPTKTVGIVETLELPPESILVVSVSPDVLDVDMARLRHEFRTFFEQHQIKVPVAIVRGGDMKFLRLVEVSE